MGPGLGVGTRSRWVGLRPELPRRPGEPGRAAMDDGIGKLWSLPGVPRMRGNEMEQSKEWDQFVEVLEASGELLVPVRNQRRPVALCLHWTEMRIRVLSPFFAFVALF